MNPYFKETDYIHYSNCHEDVTMLWKQLQEKDKVALSIGSAGDNSFALLTKKFAKVYVIDKNPSQIYLIKLKAAAFQDLNYDELLILLGLKSGNTREIYHMLRKNLDSDTKSYFDNHLFLIENGLIHSGRFENYFQIFKKYVLSKTHSHETIQQFLSFTNIEDQWEFYQKKFNNWRWKLLFKIFFSKYVMKRLGRDEHYFKYCKTSLSTKIKDRLELGFQNTLNSDNPYMQYPILNRYLTLPYYLQPEHFETIKANIHKLEYLICDLTEIQDLKIDFFNLSDIFEYISEDETKQLEKILIQNSNPHATYVFWNMMVPRKFCNDCFEQLESYKLSDRAFFYQDLRVYKLK